MCSYQPTVVLVIDDPDFGLLRASSHDHGAVWLWEALDRVETTSNSVDLSFDAGPDGPDNSHRHQFKALVAEIGWLIGRAAPIVSARASEWVCSRWDGPSADFEWQGAHLTGRPGTFTLYLSCIACPDSLVAVQFQDSNPVKVEIGDD